MSEFGEGLREEELKINVGKSKVRKFNELERHKSFRLRLGSGGS